MSADRPAGRARLPARGVGPPNRRDGVYEIGGRDILTYREMMQIYAQVRGLRRVIIALPVPRPQLSSRFVGLVTPIPYRLAQPLVESLRTEVVVRDDRALRNFSVRPIGLAGNWLWQARGLIDRLVGGVGMRRGRRHPRELMVGEPVDFWRVEALQENRLLRLRAEMKLPGAAWLQFEVAERVDGTAVEQTAFYDPHGFLGYLYWYLVLPFHRFIFPGLLAAVRQRAEEAAATAGDGD